MVLIGTIAVGGSICAGIAYQKQASWNTPDELLTAYMAYIPEEEYEKMYEMLKIEASGNIAQEEFIKRNSAFFNELYYQIEYDMPISKDNVSVEWTTIMGNPQPTKDGQIALADIKLSSKNKVYSQRKINFVKKAVEIIVDTINKE